VPIGALFGAGKRKGLYGSYLLAAYNSDMEVYESICKIGTGFSD
jgi:DNA ligase-1